MCKLGSVVKDNLLNGSLTRQVVGQASYFGADLLRPTKTELRVSASIKRVRLPRAARGFCVHGNPSLSLVEVTCVSRSLPEKEDVPSPNGVIFFSLWGK